MYLHCVYCVPILCGVHLKIQQDFPTMATDYNLTKTRTCGSPKDCKQFSKTSILRLEMLTKLPQSQEILFRNRFWVLWSIVFGWNKKIGKHLVSFAFYYSQTWLLSSLTLTLMCWRLAFEMRGACDVRKKCKRGNLKSETLSYEPSSGHIVGTFCFKMCPTRSQECCTTLIRSVLKVPTLAHSTVGQASKSDGADLVTFESAVTFFIN